MNEQLKFSWGHIIAFLALIAISYLTFVGMTYWTADNFTKAIIWMVIIDVVLFLFFIGVQMLKATTKKFHRCIILERILICMSPIILTICLLPAYHFASVLSHNKEITDNFTTAVEDAQKLFDNYNDYAENRLQQYTNYLDGVIANRKYMHRDFVNCGFNEGKETIQKNNMVNTLRMILLSKNYEKLRDKSKTWIKGANNGASTWNVFLLGNIAEIKIAIHSWDNSLAFYSSTILPNEGTNVNKFEEDMSILYGIDKHLDAITDRYKKLSPPTFGAILLLVLITIFLYFALLFPYFLQDRNTKSRVRLWPQTCKEESSNGSIIIDGDINNPPTTSSQGDINKRGRYKSFTLDND